MFMGNVLVLELATLLVGDEKLLILATVSVFKSVN